MHLTNSTPAAARITTGALGLLAAAGVGCGSQGSTASMGQLAPVSVAQAPATLSLGAGDALGQIVYVNDVILALGGNPSEFWAMSQGSMPTLANLQASATIAALPIMPRTNAIDVRNHTDPFEAMNQADAPIATVLESVDPGQ